MAHGSITAGGQTGASVTLTGTAAQIDAALKSGTYKGALNYTGSDSLSVVTTDTADSQTATLAERITLTANVAPAASVMVQYAATAPAGDAAPSSTGATTPTASTPTVLAKPHLLS